MRGYILRLYAVLYICPSDKKEVAEQAKAARNLSDKEQGAFNYIVDSLAKRGHAPSLRRIANAIGRKSSRTAFRVVNRLVSMGLIERDRNGQLRIK